MVCTLQTILLSANSYVIGNSELGEQACPHHPWPTPPGLETRLGPWPRLIDTILTGTGWQYHCRDLQEQALPNLDMEKVLIGDNSGVLHRKDQEGNAEIARLDKQLPAISRYV